MIHDLLPSNKWLNITAVALDEHMIDFGSGLNLTATEKLQLVAFLQTLSDNNFLTNQQYADPE